MGATVEANMSTRSGLRLLTKEDETKQAGRGVKGSGQINEKQRSWLLTLPSGCLLRRRPPGPTNLRERPFLLQACASCNGW